MIKVGFFLYYFGFAIAITLNGKSLHFFVCIGYRGDPYYLGT